MSGQASKPKDEECAVSTSQVPQCVTQHQCVQCKLSSSEQGRTSESRADSPEPAGAGVVQVNLPTKRWVPQQTC
eukprot:scaffold70591_cov21-Tisochrysis_lutea.AAC.1